MSRSHSYHHEIEKLNNEIKRLNLRLQELRQRKKQQEKYLYESMKTWGEHKVGNYTLASLERKANPKPMKRRKGEKAKRKDAVLLFRQIGIPDPEKFWVDFENTQHKGYVQRRPFT